VNDGVTIDILGGSFETQRNQIGETVCCFLYHDHGAVRTGEVLCR
jgi:hypothetical protein